MLNILRNRILLLCFGLWLTCLPGVKAQLQEMPDFTAVTVYGEEYRLGNGNVQVVVFLDEIEDSTNALLAELNKVTYAFRMRNFELLTIIVPSEPNSSDGLAAVVDELSLFFPLCVDAQAQILPQFEIQAPPAVFIANVQGKIVYQTADISLRYEKLKGYVKQAFGFVEQNQQPTMGALFEPDVEKLVADTKQFAPRAEKQPTADKTALVDGAAVVTEKISEQSLVHTSVLSGIISEKPLGYKPTDWGLTTNLQQAIFFAAIDIAIHLLPLIIWGWGMLFCLAKITRYRGMFYGFIACSGFGLWQALQILLRLPDEICILFPELWQYQQAAAQYYHHYFVAFLSPSVNVSAWKPELVLLLLLQIALIRGLAGRIKNEEVYS